ncbi:MAG: hypothetical protein L0H96_04890 [Humibacillus sp.]|nr:hypothetical protein [Humibacillus sp.]MDN5776226.1 hypothetical protein [Humibacillus sp.]
MNPDVNELLEAASADVHEVDFAERAWAGAHRRRSRRQAAAGIAAAAVIAVGFGTYQLGTRNAPPPSNPRPSVTQTVTNGAWKTAPDGTLYAIAPPLGTESTLPRAEGVVPQVIDPSAGKRTFANYREVEKRDLEKGIDPDAPPTAVYLEAVDAAAWADAGRFRPVFVRRSGVLVGSDVELTWVNDRAGNRALSLAPGAFSRSDRVAFPQPGGVVLVDLRDGSATTYPVPSELLTSVRWSDTDSLVVSGDDGGWSLDLTQSSPKAVAVAAGYDGGTNTISVDSAKGPIVTEWRLDGTWNRVDTVTAPVRSTYGPTITQRYVAASAVVLDGTLGAVSGAPASQGILTVPLHDLGARRLLVLGETPKRPTGCCTVAGLIGNDGVI